MVRNFRLKSLEIGQTTVNFGFSSEAKLSFVDNRLCYQLPHGDHLYILVSDLSNLKKITLNNEAVSVEFHSPQANTVLFKLGKNSTNLNNLRLDDTRDHKKINSKKKFVFRNVTYTNAYPQLLTETHRLEVWQNQVKRLTGFCAASRLIAPDQEEEEVEPAAEKLPVKQTASDRDDEEEMVPAAKKLKHSEDSIGESDENTNCLNGSMNSSPAMQCYRNVKAFASTSLKKPCCGEEIHVESINDVKNSIICPNAKCQASLIYSFCQQKLVFSEFVYHCKHVEVCTFFTNPCKKCEK